MVERSIAWLTRGARRVCFTKLDVLTGLEQVPVCVAWDVDGVRYGEMPVDQMRSRRADI